jgi:hypothetical protein
MRRKKWRQRLPKAGLQFAIVLPWCPESGIIGMYHHTWFLKVLVYNPPSLWYLCYSNLNRLRGLLRIYFLKKFPEKEFHGNKFSELVHILRYFNFSLTI